MVFGKKSEDKIRNDVELAKNISLSLFEFLRELNGEKITVSIAKTMVLPLFENLQDTNFEKYYVQLNHIIYNSNKDEIQKSVDIEQIVFDYVNLVKRIS